MNISPSATKQKERNAQLRLGYLLIIEMMLESFHTDANGMRVLIESGLINDNVPFCLLPKLRFKFKAAQLVLHMTENKRIRAGLVRYTYTTLQSTAMITTHCIGGW